MAVDDTLPEPASGAFIRWLHHEFYRDVPEALLQVAGSGRHFLMSPGEWRSRPEYDVVVGRHVPPSSNHVADFMDYFEGRYRFDGLGKAGARIKAIGTAARHELETFFDTRVFLDLHIKVREGWREDDRMLVSIGLPSRRRRGR